MDVKGKYIIFADDNAFFSNVFCAELTKGGYKVDAVSNGQEVLDLVKKQKPDLIILDLIMPVKDGFETLIELKNSEEFKDIKVAVLSNLGQNEDIEKAKKLGAAGYIVKKDIAVKNLLDIVRQYVK